MKSLFFFFIIAALLISCEYKTNEDYFREVEPPAAFAPIEINLNDVDPADTIYIIDQTVLTFGLNTYSRELKELHFMLGTNELHPSSGNKLVIRPVDFDAGKYKLTVVAAFSSGTGSLADMMGMEGYMGEISWNICIIKNFNPELKLGYRKNADNFLELYWDTQHVPAAIFEKYEVSAPKSITITDQSHKSVVLEDYIYGHANSSVTLYIKCADGYSRTYYQSLSFDSPVPKLYFENQGVNKLRVYWDKPFANARYVLEIMNGTAHYETNDTSIVIATPPFTTTVNYWLNMYPENSTTTETIYYLIKGYSLGARGIYAYDATYYKFQNKILAVSGRLLYSVDLQTLNETVEIESGSYSKISCVPGSNKIAVMQRNSFFIYDESFINPVIVYKSDDSFRDTDFFGLTNNERLFIVDYYSANCEVYNANTGELLFTFDIVEKPASRSVSADGKYFCCASGNGLTIYMVGVSGIENALTLPNSYAKAMFNPANPQQLIVLTGGELKILNVPDFQSIYSTAAPNSTLLDIDPATGNILYYRRYELQDSLHVIRTSPIIEPTFSVATYRSEIKLKGNLLMDNSNSHVLDITPYLKP